MSGVKKIMGKKIKTSAVFKGQIKNKKLRGVLKLLLSLFILYHLTMTFVTPHYMSIVHEKMMPYFKTYAHTLSFTTSWDFYAPNPSYYNYFEYEVVHSKNKVETFRWPLSRKESKQIYLNHNRLIYHSRFFMVLGKRYIIKHFIPYLCSLHPLANEITVKVMVENRPHFKKAKVLDPNTFSSDNKKNMRKWFSASSRCRKQVKSRNINTADDDFLLNEENANEDNTENDTTDNENFQKWEQGMDE